VFLTKYYSFDKIRKNTLCGSCGVYLGREKGYKEFWWEKLGRRDKLEDLGVDGKVISK
jgi:hypothetical protein